MNPNFAEYSASDYRAIARRALKGAWGLAVGVTLLAAVLGGVSTSFSFSINLDDRTLFELRHYFPQIMPQLMQLLWRLAPLITFFSTLSLVQLLIGGAVEVGLCRFYLHRLDGRPAAVGDLFSAFNIFGRTLWLHVLIGLKVFAWSLLLIIPGIVAIFRYAMAPYILAENPNLTASQAIELSKQMMDGRKGELFVLCLSFIGWAFLSALTFGIGMLWLTPYMGMAEAAFYRSVAPAVYFRQQPNGGGQQPGDNYQRPDSDWARPSDSDYRSPEL